MLICKKSLIFTLYNFFVQHPAPDNQIGAGLGRQQHVSSVLSPHSFCPTIELKLALLHFWFIWLNQYLWCLILAENSHSWTDPGGCWVQTRHVLTLHHGWYWPIHPAAAATSQPDGKRFHNSHNFYSRIVLAKQSTNKTFQSNVSLKRFKLCRGYYWGLLKHILDVFEIHILWLF